MPTALRIALRSLAKTPGFTAIAVLTLALCLGANFTIYAVVDAVLVRALPFPEPERLVCLFNGYPGAGAERSGTSVPNYFDRRGALPALPTLAMYQDGSVIVGDGDSPDRVPLMRVTPEFFATLGVPLALGRTFTDDELTYSTDQVAVLTDRFWRNHFNADPNVVGRTFLNDGLTVTVVGVLPPGFRFLSSRAEFFRPASHAVEDRAPDRRHSNSYAMVARLAPGASLETAQAQIDALNANLLVNDPLAQLIRDAGYHTTVRSLHADHVRAIRPTLVLLQAGVFCLLIIGAFNLANLLLIRANSRMRDLAVRQALGAGRRHIIAQVVVETMLLTLGGALLGILLGSFGIDLTRTLGTDLMPLGATVEFNGRVAVASLFVALLVGLLIAAPIVWFNLRAHLAETLQSGSRGGTTGRAAQRVRHVFIVAQITIAFVLVTGAGLLSRSLARALDTPSGFSPDQVLSGQISLPWKSYQNNEATLAFAERLLPALRQIPGVSHAALSTGLPFSERTNDSVVAIEGQPPQPGKPLLAHYLSWVSAEYWAAMRIPLLRGRLLEDADSHREARVCVVDQAFAERYWPGQDPLGRRIAQDINVTPENAFTIVGVVGEVKQAQLTEKAGHGAVYFPQQGHGGFSIILRSGLAPQALAPAVRKAVLQLDPGLPVDDLRPLRDRIADTLVIRRSPAILAAVFGGVALLLSGLGTYGMLSYAVNQRQREIGVRAALGAQPEEIRRQFLGMGLRLLAVGLVFGGLGAWLIGQALQTLLYGVPPLHAPTLAIATATMITTVLLACWLPVVRATRVSPLIALRGD
ncbi:MAG TPA: ABC transporter permease [Opitutaceae bacterium]|nr:ABC transporter permease [Opitutaceae bacterium]